MQEHETITKGTKKYRNFTKTKAMEKEQEEDHRWIVDWLGP